MIGARGGSRTHTPVKAGDFESPASTIPPLGQPNFGLAFATNNVHRKIEPKDRLSQTYHSRLARRFGILSQTSVAAALMYRG